MKKRLTALAAAGLMAAACLTGCGNKNSSTTVLKSGNSSSDGQEPEVTLGPGVEYTAQKGEEFTYEKTGLDVNFTEISLTSDRQDSQGRYTYALVFTAKNNGTETTEVHMLDDFSISVDGKEYDSKIFSAISAANGALAYSGYLRYDAELEPGDSIEGFIPFSIDTIDWKELTVTYKPDRVNSNDTIVYTVERSELVNKF